MIDIAEEWVDRFQDVQDIVNSGAYHKRLPDCVEDMFKEMTCLLEAMVGEAWERQGLRLGYFGGPVLEMALGKINDRLESHIQKTQMGTR